MAARAKLGERREREEREGVRRRRRRVNEGLDRLKKWVHRGS